MATHESLLIVEDLHVSYGTKEVLHGIDYSISECEVVAVLGANGSGKSTSLNTISGFVAPSSGRIVFDGADITNLPATRYSVTVSYRCPNHVTCSPNSPSSTICGSAPRSVTAARPRNIWNASSNISRA